MTKESLIDAVAIPEQVQDVVVANVPADVFLALTQEHGPALMTAALGVVGIRLINQGSSEYARAAESKDPEATNTLLRNASGNILLGGSAMTVTALAAGDPLFAYPEALIVLTSLKPYLESRFPQIQQVLAKLHANIVLAGGAVAGGAATIAHHADSAWEALPAAGLTTLAVAFSMGNDETRQSLYRALTISGGSALVIGSAHAMSENYQGQNTVGLMMSSAFFALNLLFTSNELKEARKLPAIQKIIDRVRGAFTR